MSHDGSGVENLSAPAHREVAAEARLWLPVVLVASYWIAYFGVGLTDVPMLHRVMFRMAALGLLTLIYLTWWIASRRLPRDERFIVLGGAAIAMAATMALLHPSIHGLQVVVVFWALPFMFTAWTAWLLITRYGSAPSTRNGMIALAVLAWAWSDAVRLEGLAGQGDAEFKPRWTLSSEELFLAEHSREGGPAKASATDDSAEPLVATPADWPNFRGPERDGAVHGVKIRTDLNENPPKLAWKRRVGPGWSSIIVIGNRIFTQEQRDENEAVVAFDANTGDEIWAHEDKERFDEAMGGAGPRATPTFADGKLFALGAEGLLNCLDAATGKKLWSRDIMTDGQGTIPYWGFCSSPLVVDGKVIVFAGGGGKQSHPTGSSSGGKADATQAAANEKKKTLIAYDAASGEIAWQAASGNHSYSSPQLATIGGAAQVLFVSDAGLQANDPATGEQLWTVPANGKETMPTLQPHVLGSSQLLASFKADAGFVRADVSHGSGGWQVKAETSNGASGDLKPFFNDFVQSGDALYGFDGSMFSCVDAKTGERRWPKKARYGSGQVLLIADQPVLLVLAESGVAALVACNPDKHEELGRFQAIEGKTWNHPTIAHGRLYVRNAQEMACYEL